MRRFAVAITLLLTMLSPLMGGAASASTASSTGSVGTVQDVTPQALHKVCAETLTMRGTPGGEPNPEKVLAWGNLVNTVDWDGAWALVDALEPPIGRGWVVGKYLC